MANIYDLSDTWSDAGTTFTAIKMNVTDSASDASSLLMDLQVGGTSKFKVDKSGTAYGALSGNITNTNLGIISNPQCDFRVNSLSIGVTVSGSLARYGWGATAASSADLILARDAADTLAQRRSTNAQTFNLYNTYTDASNYERASFTQTATGLVLDAQYSGTGLEPNNILELKSGGSSKFSVSKAGSVVNTNNGSSAAPSFGIGASNVGFYRSGDTLYYVTAGPAHRFGIGNSGAELTPVGAISWSGTISQANATKDLILARDAANTLAQRNSTNAQTFNLYNTYTDASNYERGFMKWNSNVLEIGTEAAGTGSARSTRLVSASQMIISPASNVMFIPNGGGSQVYIVPNTGTVYGNAGLTLGNSNNALNLRPGSTNGVSIAGNFIEAGEMTAPSAPSTDKVRIYAEDNGSGKTRLMALFPTGAAQQIAIEP